MSTKRDLIRRDTVNNETVRIFQQLIGEANLDVLAERRRLMSLSIPRR
jgi:hypothetical protein